jgi:AraC family transcriptional regulator of arabinose operon
MIHSDNPRLVPLIQYIDETLSGVLSVLELSRRAGMSTSHLAHTFKKTLGISMEGYVRRRRLQKAAELLQTTSLSIKEIACAVGIPNARHFARTFRREMGCPPTVFRKKQKLGTA